MLLFQGVRKDDERDEDNNNSVVLMELQSSEMVFGQSSLWECLESR